MRSNQLTGALAVLATSSLIGLGSGAAQAQTDTGHPDLAGHRSVAGATTTHERGIVLECTGVLRGRQVYTSIYESNVASNTLQILIGDDEHQVGGSRDTERDFLVDRQVTARMKVGGKRAVITGPAHARRARHAVHETYDDAGQHITVDGYHRRIVSDLQLTWRRHAADLDCDTAFRYDLQVTKEPVTE
jgi:hypothetical protein